MQHLFRASLHRLGHIALAASPLAASLAAQTADYEQLIDRPREFTNFNIETTRGLVFDGLTLYALNTHGSRVVVHEGFDGNWERNFPTLNQPVAMDLWIQSGVKRVVVAGGGSHALMVHDALSGDVIGVLNLPSEPGDVVVHDALNRAYVACMGTNEVVEVDLTNLSILNRFPIASRRPRFLNLEVDANPASYSVFVTPMASGNNTVADHSADDTSTVLALPPDDPASPMTLEGLPDEDLFVLRFGGASPVVEPVAKGLGGIVTAHSRNPETDAYWVLSLVPENANPAKQNEPALQHDFVTNALRILPDTDQLRHAALGTVTEIDLDDPGSSNHSPCSFPVALAFDSEGRAAIAGSTSDRIAFHQANGDRFAAIDLPPGSIPRDLEILEVAGFRFLFVLCWGTNEVLVYNLFHIQASPVVLDMGFDPTPPAIARGRAHWYDADNSSEGQATCNSCHPGGASDLIGWQLEDPLRDLKDVMVTQSLLSIEDTFPYHWRGERDLGDFNRLAFPGLLGGSQLDTAPGGDFDDLREFIFSLQAPRNPHQSLERVVDDSLATAPRPGIPAGSAVDGQKSFQTIPTVGGTLTCVECHAFPQGTNGDISFDGRGTIVTTNFNMDVTHLRQLFDKEGDMLSTSAGIYPEFGFGLAHEGEFSDIFDFNGATVFGLAQSDQADISAFVSQMDQGIAPMAQSAWLLAPSGAGADITRLLNQAAIDSYLDAVVLGLVSDAAGNTQQVTWLYDPSSGDFVADDPTFLLKPGSTPGTASLAELESKAAAGDHLAFLGVPPGNGLGFALDIDRDDLWNGLEAAQGTSPHEPDFDGDGFGDGYEVAHPPADPTDASSLVTDTQAPQVLSWSVDYISGSSAQVRVAFSEPVTYSATWTRLSTGETKEHRRLDFVGEDTFVLQGLVPSSPAGEFFAPGQPPQANPGVDETYRFSLDLSDQSGNPLTFGPVNLGQTTDGIEVLAFGRLEVKSLKNTVTGTTADVQVQILPIHRDMAGDTIGQYGPPSSSNPATPQVERVPVFRVLVQQGSDWVPAQPGDIAVSGSTTAASDYQIRFTPTDIRTVDDYSPGVLLFGSPTLAVVAGSQLVGQTNIQFTNLTGYRKFRLQLVGLFREWSPGTRVFTAFFANSWLMPFTPDELRGVDIDF